MKRTALLLACLLPLTIGADEPRRAADAPSESAVVNEAVTAQLALRKQNDVIRAALQAKHTADWKEVPLVQWLQEMEKISQHTVRLDLPALREEGIPEDKLVTLTTSKPMPLSHLLTRALKARGLTWFLDHGEIVITTMHRANSVSETRIYSIGPLLRLAEQRDAKWRAAVPAADAQPTPRSVIGVNGSVIPSLALHQPTLEENLTNLLEAALDAEWHGNASGFLLKIVGDQMIVRQSPPQHDKLAALLRAMTTALQREFGSVPLLVAESDTAAAETARLQQRLDTKVNVAFSETPLSDALMFLQDSLEEEIYLDESALQNEGIATDTPVTFSDHDSARALLRRILKPMGLTTLIDDGAIRVTTQSEAYETHQVAVYDLAEITRDDGNIVNVIELIENTTSGPWQNTDGDGGLITDFSGALLVVKQRPAVQDEIALLLHELQQARRAAAKDRPREPARTVETRFYRAASAAEAEDLEELILTFVAPRTWDSAGGFGATRTIEDRLIVRHTKAVQEQVEHFLRQYRDAKTLSTPGEKK